MYQKLEMIMETNSTEQWLFVMEQNYTFKGQFWLFTNLLEVQD